MQAHQIHSLISTGWASKQGQGGEHGLQSWTDLLKDISSATSLLRGLSLPVCKMGLDMTLLLLREVDKII